MLSQKITTSILMIYTGGTIGMMENPETGMLEPFDFKHLMYHVPELRRFGFEIASVEFNPSLDSAEMNPEIWERIVRIISDNYDRYDGFVVLHGTDTMAYTASALSFMLVNLDKPVIFTGSQLPIGKLRTDGKENLIGAIELAAARRDGQAIVPEVCIYFQNKLFRGNRTSKVSAEHFHAFNSPNYPPLAIVGIHHRFEEHLILRSSVRKPFVADTLMDSNVIVLKLFPGIKPETVDALLSIPNLKGVVLETYGSGNAPRQPWFADCLKRAIESGITIVNVSQCASGAVDMSIYGTGRFLRDLGVVNGMDMTTEATVTKLMYLLGKDLSQAQIASYMSTSLAGEITVGSVSE